MQSKINEIENLRSKNLLRIIYHIKKNWFTENQRLFTMT